MTAPDLPALVAAIAATWPAAETRRVGRFTVARGAGGGNRVSAARLADPADPGNDLGAAEIAAVAAAQAAWGQPPLVQVFGPQAALDATLAAAGYVQRDATVILAAPVAEVAAAPPPVTCFDIWPPLAVQAEIWAEGGIGPARLAVMERAAGPKTALFGRQGDRPAGTAFLALHDGIAMLHALEIAPRARRKGLAAHMMRAAGAWAAAQGAHSLAVLVTRENLPAQGLYASLRLQPVGHYAYRTTPPGPEPR